MLRGSATSARLRRALAATAVLVAATLVAAADVPSTASRVPQPTVTSPAGQCVEDTAFMRRNHMELIRHQRDLTVREGIRTTKHSLANCIDCHADPKTGRATGSREAFCEGCHRYAAVKLDCFECHSDRARTAARKP